jgi:IS605 OrfB family transposase
VLVKLAPTPEQHAALLRTVENVNAACNAIAGAAFAARCANKIALQQLVYYDIRARFGLSAQMTIRAMSTVSEAYQRDTTKQPHFRPQGAMVYDERILSFHRSDRASLLTLDGRMEVPFRCGAYAEGMLYRTRGQADLLYRASSDTFLLAMSVDAPEPTPDDTAECVGVDLGVIQLATTSDGEFLKYSTGPKHAQVNQVRARSSRFRQKVQKKGTKSAKRLLKKRSGTAQGTQRGIALEDLQGIRERAGNTVRTRHRSALHRWSFFQLRAFIAYKAAPAGVRVVYVNPAYTSQTCSACGQCEQANRTTQSSFLWCSCGFYAHAEVNAAVNNARRAAVIPPDAAARAG